MNQNMRKIKSFFDYYVKETVIKNSEIMLKELATKRLAKEARLAPILIIGFLTTALFFSIGFGVLFYGLSQLIFEEMHSFWMNWCFLGSMLIFLGLAITLFIIRYTRTVVNDVEQIFTTEKPKKALLSPFIDQLQKERQSMLEEFQ